MTNAEKKLATIEDFITNQFDADTDYSKPELSEMLDHVAGLLGTVDGTLATLPTPSEDDGGRTRIGNTPEVGTDDDADESEDEAQEREDADASGALQFAIVNAIANHYRVSVEEIAAILDANPGTQIALDGICMDIHDQYPDGK